MSRPLTPTPGFKARKVYSDLPASHRIHTHPRCGKEHGHNWSVALTFATDTLDEHGFVLDFGAMGAFRLYLTDLFDHTVILPSCLEEQMRNNTVPWGRDVRFIDQPTASCEYIAKHIYEVFNSRIANGDYDKRLKLTRRNVRLVKVEVFEDSKNSASYEQALT